MADLLIAASIMIGVWIFGTIAARTMLPRRKPKPPTKAA